MRYDEGLRPMHSVKDCGRGDHGLWLGMWRTFSFVEFDHASIYSKKVTESSSSSQLRGVEVTSSVKGEECKGWLVWGLSTINTPSQHAKRPNLGHLVIQGTCPTKGILLHNLISLNVQGDIPKSKQNVRCNHWRRLARRPPFSQQLKETIDCVTSTSWIILIIRHEVGSIDNLWTRSVTDIASISWHRRRYWSSYKQWMSEIGNSRCCFVAKSILGRRVCKVGFMLNHSL